MSAVPAVGDDVAKLRVGVSYSKDKSSAPLDGRVLLMLSTDDSREPRFQIGGGPGTQQVFGVDVDGLAPGADHACLLWETWDGTSYEGCDPIHSVPASGAAKKPGKAP